MTSPLPTLQPRSTIREKAQAKLKEHNLTMPASTQPQCSASQCQEIQDNLNKRSNQRRGIITSIGGGMGMGPDYWHSLNNTIQDYNNDPELNKLIKNQKIEEDYYRARKNADNAQNEYDSQLKVYCKSHETSRICKDIDKLEREITDGKVNELKARAADLSNNIMILIDTYSAELLALDRMEELLGTRIQEFKVDESTINDVVKTIQTDSRKGFYQQEEHDFLDETKIFLIFLYYVLFIFYLFVSNFFPEQAYKKFANIILIIIFLAIPFLVQHIVSMAYEFINSFLIRFDFKKDDIRSRVIASPN